jgi:hypothetical protein
VIVDVKKYLVVVAYSGTESMVEAGAVSLVQKIDSRVAFFYDVGVRNGRRGLKLQAWTPTFWAWQGNTNIDSR